MTPPPLTKTDTFKDPFTGEPLPKWFESEAGGSRLEWSMHDPTIKHLLPTDFWLPVFACSQKTLRQDVLNDSLVFLIGFGTDSDSSGRLMLIRYTIDRARLQRGCTATTTHFAHAVAMVQSMLSEHGFDPDKSVWDSIAKN